MCGCSLRKWLVCIRSRSTGRNGILNGVRGGVLCMAAGDSKQKSRQNAQGVNFTHSSNVSNDRDSCGLSVIAEGDFGSVSEDAGNVSEVVDKSQPMIVVE